MRNGAVLLALTGGRTWPFAGSACSGAVKADGESCTSMSPTSWDRGAAAGARDNGSDRAEWADKHVAAATSSGRIGKKQRMSMHPRRKNARMLATHQN